MSAKLNEFGRRRSRRWWMSGATLLAVLVFGIVFAASSGANLPNSTFEGTDGNLIVDGAAGSHDWANQPGVHIGIDQLSGANDNAFGQGTKEDNASATIVTGSIPPSKNDLTRFYATSEFLSATQNFLYLSWQRTNTNGDANLDFELNQNTTASFTGATTGAVTLNRTPGDILVTYDFGGSGTPTIGVLTWITSANGTAADCFSSNALPCWGKQHGVAAPATEAAVNAVSVLDPLNGNASLAAGQFGEVAINLNQAGVFPANQTCEAFGNVWVKSRSSSSFSAEVKDFIAPNPIHVSNCGTVELKKHWVGTPDSVSLNIGSSQNGTQVASTTATTDGATTGEKAVGDNTYYMSEPFTTPANAANYASTLACTRDGQAAAADANNGISVTAGHAVVCTFTNTRKTGTIEVVKHLSPASDAGRFNLLVDGAVKKADAANNDTTGAVTVDTGSHAVSETQGTGTSSSAYSSTYNCLNGQTQGPTGSGTSVPAFAVASGDTFVCTFTNTLKTGTIQVVKHLSPSSDPGLFNLLVDGAVKKADATNNDTTPVVTVGTGSHAVSETQGTNTVSSNYTSTYNCMNGQTQGPTGSGTSVPAFTVAQGDTFVCTFTNTRDTGTIQVVKHLSPSSDPGLFNLLVDGTIKKANATNNDATPVVTVNTGGHAVSETQGTNTVGSDYTSTYNCMNGQTQGPAGNGTSVPAFTVAKGDSFVCTFTNARNTGTIEVVKHLSPTTDPGLFNLLVDGTIKKANATHNDTTGAVAVNTGSHAVSETEGTNTLSSNYTSTYNCMNGQTQGPTGSGTSVPSFAVASGDTFVCTFTNTRKTGTIQVVKHLSPSDDPGLFNLLVDGAVKKADAANNDSTPVVTVNTGSHAVSETQGTSTVSSDYTSTYNCMNGQTQGPAGNGASIPAFAVASGDTFVCTFTNTRKTGTIQVVKHLSPIADPGLFDLLVDGTVKKADATNNDSTPVVTVNTGSHAVSETQGTNTLSSDYASAYNCMNGQTQGPAGIGTSVPAFTVASGDTFVCTFTNTRHMGTIQLQKKWVGEPGTTTLAIDRGETPITSKSVSSNESTDKVTVPTGDYAVSETGGLANYASSLACFNDNGASGGTADNGSKDGGEPDVTPPNATTTSGTVSLGNGDHIVCVLTNTRAQGSIELKKAWAGTAGNVTLNIGTTASGQELYTKDLTGTDGTTGPRLVNTGTYFVSEAITPLADASNYSPQLACFNDANDNGTQQEGEGDLQNGFAVGAGDHVVCTFTNRELPQIKLVKSLDPSTDDGTFDFAIDQQSFDNGGDGYGDKGTTGFVHIQPGAPVISELGHGDTDLSAYDSSISCSNEDGTDGTSLDMSALTYGDKVTCTFTNHRLPTITIGKRVVPASDAGTFDFTVDPGEGELVVNNGGAGYGNNGSAEVIVSTGTHTITESGHGNTLGADYASSWSCSNERSGAGTSIALDEVGYGDNIVCTFTNTKLATLIVVKNVDNSNGGGSKASGDFTLHVAGNAVNFTDPGTSAGKTYAHLLPGLYTVSEDAVSGYNLSGITGCDNGGAVMLNAGQTVTCTLTNKSNAPPPPPPPAPPAPRVDLSITKNASPNPASLGGPVTWTMVVTNNGPSNATGVTVADPVPAGMTFVSATSSQGTCIGGAIVSCQIGNVSVGSSVTITLTTTANATGTITNTATTVAREAETNTANNTASASTLVNGAFVPPVKPVTYCTAVAVSPKTLFAGRTVVLTVHVAQHGKAVAGVRVRIKGSTIGMLTKPSNKQGVVKTRVNPKRAGIVTFAPLAQKSCKNPRIGVTGVFTPPVTG